MTCNPIQFRALKGGNPHARNKTFSVSIPHDMVRVLGWSNMKPIQIELVQDGALGSSLRLTQVDPDEVGLVLKLSHWVYRYE